MTKQDDRDFPALDQHSTDLLSSILNRNNENESNTSESNVVHDPISGMHLEHRELARTSENQT